MLAHRLLKRHQRRPTNPSSWAQLKSPLRNQNQAWNSYWDQQTNIIQLLSNLAKSSSWKISVKIPHLQLASIQRSRIRLLSQLSQRWDEMNNIKKKINGKKSFLRPSSKPSFAHSLTWITSTRCKVCYWATTVSLWRQIWLIVKGLSYSALQP